MNRPIDEKIVVMKLDNSDLRKKATETTSLFGKIQESMNKIPGVNLGKPVKELGNINTAASNVKLDHISNNLQTITKNFSAMGVVGLTVLANLANRAVNAGMAMTKSLTLDQVNAGFAEYELKMGSIQTILANTSKHGTKLEDVSKALNELNDYADQTIYNFGDMTKNIGLFTNAGLKLEESTSMIKGFSNAAAASGTNAEGASRAAYQLSQALSSGYMMQMDWMSLTNAGMGNDNMKRDLIALGQAMGTLNKDTEYTMTNWKELLSKDKWLTSDVMSTYLQAMAGDLDKATLMAQGLSEVQAEVLLKNAKIGLESATMVRTFSGLMGGLRESIGSGWATTFEHMFGNFDEATKLWSKLSEQVNGFFTDQAKNRNVLMEAIANEGGFLNIFEGLENSLKPIMQITGAVKDGFREIFPPATASQIVKITEMFKEFTAGLTISQDRIGQLTTIFQGVFSIFSTVWEIAKRLTQAFVNLIPEGTGGSVLDILEKIAQLAIGFNESVKEGNALTSFIDGLGVVLGTIGSAISDVISDIVGFGSSVKDVIGNAVDWLMVKLAPVGKFLRETFGDFGGDDILGAGTLVGAIAVVASIMSKITGVFDGLSDITDGIGDVLDGVGDALQNFSMGIKIGNLLLIATSVGILAVALKTLEGISVADISKGIVALSTALGAMIVGMMVIDKFGVTGGIRASVNLIALATAVTIMASALKKISDLSPGEMTTGILGLVSVTGALTAAVIAMSKFGGQMGTSSLQLVALAGAVLILAEAIETMSAIDTGDLFKSVGALALIFTQMAVFLKVVDGTKLNISSALGLIAVAGAVQMMVNAIQDLESVDVDTLIKGLSTIALILVQVGLFANLVKGPSLASAGVGMLLIAGAINALVGPITELGQLSWTELIKGLGAMALALAAVAGAAMLMNGGMAGAAGILIMAGALNAIVGPIERFGAMTWGELIKGFIGLAGGLGLLAGVATLLTPAVPSMLAFGAAVLLMGAAVTAVGAGIALFGVGLTTLATLTATSIAAIVSALGLLLQSLASLIPEVLDFVVKLVSALLDGIAELAPKIVDTIVELVMALLRTVERHLPEFLTLGVNMIVHIMNGLAEALPKLVSAGFNLMKAFIRTLAETVAVHGPELREEVLNLLGEILILFINAGTDIITAMFGWIPGVNEAATAVAESAEKYIRDNFGAEAVAKDKGDEFSTGLTSKEGNVKIAAKGLADAGIGQLDIADAAPSGQKFATSFIGGMMSKINTVSENSGSIGSAALTALKKTLDTRSPSKETDKIGQDTGQGFANGITKKKKTAAKSAKSVATAAKNSFKEAMESAEFKFEMGKINSTEYISELEKIKRSYSKYPDMVRDVEKEIKKVREDADKRTIKLRKEQLDKEKKILDDRKYYNQLSITEEYQAWLKISKMFKKGTEERAEADRELYRIKNDINAKLIAMNDDYINKVQEANQRYIDSEKALTDELARAIDDRARAIANSFGLFDKISEPDLVSGQELIDNLAGQVSTLERWDKALEDLSNRNIDINLLDELTQMGPQSASKIEALVSLTDYQLNEYVELWKSKNSIAREKAIEELEWLKDDTLVAIDILRQETNSELEGYKQDWLKQIKEIRTGTTDQFVGLDTTMTQIGSNAVKGLMEGMSTMTGPLQEQARKMAESISSTIRKVLVIKSPSRLTMSDGENVAKGLALGISNNTSLVSDSASNLATETVNALNIIFDEFDIPEEDNELHFKAVIDYETLDPSKFGKIGGISAKPDTSYLSNNLVKVGESKMSEQSYRNQPSQVDYSRNYNPSIVVNSGPTSKEIARTTERTLRRLAYEVGV